MSQPSSLLIKILSLAVVVWGLMSGMSLSLQGATWVPWLALVMLMLLEAYSGDAKPASWSRWSAGLTQLLSPGMLPYYAVLILSLAIGPSQMHRDARSIPLAGATFPKPSSSLPVRSDIRPPIPVGIPAQAGSTQTARPPAFQGNKFQRPGIVPPGAGAFAPGAAAPQPAVKAPPASAKPAALPTGPVSTGSVRPPPPPSVPPSSASAASPNSSAKPAAATPTPAK